MDILGSDKELVTGFLYMFHIVEGRKVAVGDEDRLVFFIPLCHHPHRFHFIFLLQWLNDVVQIAVIKDIVQTIDMEHTGGF